MARKGKWEAMKKAGLDMVTCTSCWPNHRLQRKDFDDHQLALAGKSSMRQTYAESARASSAKRAQRNAGASSGGQGWWNR